MEQNVGGRGVTDHHRLDQGRGLHHPGALKFTERQILREAATSAGLVDLEEDGSSVIGGHREWMMLLSPGQ